MNIVLWCMSYQLIGSNFNYMILGSHEIIIYDYLLLNNWWIGKIWFAEHQYLSMANVIDKFDSV
jgi:hypothetical protein